MPTWVGILFQSRERDSISWKPQSGVFGRNWTRCFSPANGILLVESQWQRSVVAQGRLSFSPANGILLVERLRNHISQYGWKLFQSRERDSISWKFWDNSYIVINVRSFSPANGILLVERPNNAINKWLEEKFQSRERDSISWKFAWAMAIHSRM